MSCRNCEHARKACVNDGKVCCGYLTKLRLWDGMRYFDKYIKQLPLYEVYEGWANLTKRPEAESSHGILTNNAILVNGDDLCQNYKYRGRER